MSKMKTCGDCGIEKQIGEFPLRSKAKATRGSRCKSCLRDYVRARRQALSPEEKERARALRRQWYANLPPDKKRAHIKKQAAPNRRKRRELRRLILEEYRRRSCVDCGEADPLKLQFDHVRGEKTRSVADMVSRMCSWKRIKQEIEKCEARCASCHQRKTALERGWYAGLTLD